MKEKIKWLLRWLVWHLQQTCNSDPDRFRFKRLIAGGNFSSEKGITHISRLVDCENNGETV